MQETLYNVGIYCRLSTEDRGVVTESSSIQSQKESLTKYVNDQGWYVYNTYIDDGYSGTTFDRPAFKTMIEDIKKGAINLVITKDLSRLGRNYIQTGYYTEQFFPENNVRYIALNDNYDSLLEQNEFMPFKNIMNEFYAKDISKKIRFAYNARLESGDLNPPHVPFGYYKEGKVIKLDKEAAIVVREVFELYIKYGKNSKVCEILNEKGYLIPYEYLANNRKSIYGTPLINQKWAGRQVNKIIRNEAYIGIFHARKTYNLSFKDKKRRSNPRNKWVAIEDFFEPIVSKEIWLQANKIMDSQVHNPYTLEVNKYSGLLFCGHCKAKMHFVRRKYKEKITFEYMCKNYENNCSGHTVQMKELDEQVLKGLLQIKNVIFKDKDAFLTKVKDFIKRNEKRDNSNENQAIIDELLKRDKVLDTLIEKVIEKNVSGLLSVATSDSLLKKYKAEKEDIIAKLNELSKDNKQETNQISYEEQAQLLIQLLELVDENTIIDHELIHALVSRIEVKTEETKGRKNRKFIHIEYLGLPSEMWEENDGSES